MIIGDSSALIEELKPIVDEIMKSEVYISDKLMRKVLEICGE